MNASTEGLAALGVRRSLDVDEVLVHEGESSDVVYVVLSGQLVACVAAGTGEVVVGRCDPGDLIGEVAALAGFKRSATVRAIEPVKVAQIEPAVFTAWLEEHPDRAAEIAVAARQRLHSVHLAEMAITVLGDQATSLIPELLDVAEWVDIEAGATLFVEGAPADAAYFVLDGRLQATRRDADGAEQVIGDIGRSGVVGELAVIQQKPRLATVTALRDTTLAKVSIADFERLLVGQPTLTLLIVRRMVSRLTGATPAVRPARSVALLVVGDLQRDTLLDTMFAAVEAAGTASMLSSDRVDALLGRTSIAQSSATDLGDVRVSQLLSEVESAHAHVMYVADPTLTAWSRRILHRADTVVVIAPANAPDDAQRLAKTFLAACTDIRVPKWLAMVDTASASRPTAANSSPLRSEFDEVLHLRDGNASDFGRLARLSVGAGYGLVLGGGGARGFAHIGVIKALHELGIPIDRVGGASMGSIFAAGAAIYEDVDAMTSMCATQFKRLLDYTVPIVSLIKAKRITANLGSAFGGLDAEDLWVPFYCVSTNLTRSRLEVHRRGDLVTALRASIAIPGVLPPVPFGDDLLVDGGVLNNVPADVMRADRSVGTVIAVDVAAPSGPGTKENYGLYLSGWRAMRQAAGRKQVAYPGMGSVLVRTMITGSERNRAAIKADGTADLYLDLELNGVGLLDFDKMTPVIADGYSMAKPRIDEWLATRLTPFEQ